MTSRQAYFNGQVSDQFAEYAQHLRGYIRYQLVQGNLSTLTNIGKRKLSIADIGGGTGIDAVWLATQGHDVVIVDPANDQLEKARNHVRRHASKIKGKVSFIEGTAGTLLDNPEQPQFDLVLSHGVAMYLDEPRDFIRQLVQLCKPGGHISMLEKGFDGAVSQMVIDRRWKNLQSLLNNGTFRNNMGIAAHAYRPAEIIAILKEAGAKESVWRGVRIATVASDSRVSEISSEQLEQLLQVEENLGKMPHTRGMGQMIHYISRKQ